MMNTTLLARVRSEVKSRMWSVNSYTHDHAAPEDVRLHPLSTYKGGCYRSDDGGRTWDQVDAVWINSGDRTYTRSNQPALIAVCSMSPAWPSGFQKLR